MYSASSPGPRPMWYCRSPIGVAIRRSRRLSTRVSAFGKTDSSLRWLLRWRETRARIVPPANERQARSVRAWRVLSRAWPERGSGRGCPAGPATARRWCRARPVAAPAKAARRAATRAPRRRRACHRRRHVTATDSAVTAASVPSPARPGSPPSGSPRFASVAPLADSPAGPSSGAAVAAGPAAVGSAARAIPAGSLTTTASSPSTDSTVPLALTASLGSISGRSWAASPSRRTRAERRPVVDPDAAGFEVGDKAADADLLAERVGQVGEVDVTSLREWVARGRGRGGCPARRRRSAGSTPGRSWIRRPQRTPRHGRRPGCAAGS